MKWFKVIRALLTICYFLQYAIWLHIKEPTSLLLPMLAYIRSRHCRRHNRVVQAVLSCEAMILPFPNRMFSHKYSIHSVRHLPFITVTIPTVFPYIVCLCTGRGTTMLSERSMRCMLSELRMRCGDFRFALNLGRLCISILRKLFGGIFV